MVLPSYVDCENDKIYVCDYYMTKDCRESCAYAKDIMELGIGAITHDPRKIGLEDSRYQILIHEENKKKKHL